MISVFFKTKKVTTIIALLFLLISCNKNKNNPVIAHRGAWESHGLPENSIAALKQAIELECYGAEFDVHLTKDNVMVVNHDKDFMGIDIETALYDELLVLKLSNGEKIPTLKEYLEQGLKQNKTKLILEIKSAPSGKEKTLKLTKMAVELVHSLQAQSMVEYICFDFDAGQLVHQLDTNAKIAYLNGDKTPVEVLAVGYTGINYNYKVYRKNPTWMKEAQDLGLTVNSWTVNKEEDMKELLHQNIDYITTNNPELLFKVLDTQ
ncbi:glycerophosphodiester phosphodiesterase family protein [Wenyingzhuangia sp. 2_MG-2023]|uniref:glycerophosphodiester phosphodiesterase n=1 Tax=Wenyingzhuangia sp. 2_MG-2023 TaxID=3062639 RepID=UPI0026E287F0|nr:glycerophosphodiester phosphodiesterase family protein [Wenyingzhuangia sp. 2_MG-2023]MDO6738702.1 glycerophosphodiester phosphodiesterase family protein [Wenyingzhuangia sp. 2_MG-2023]